MTRFDEQPGVGFEAGKLLAVLLILLFSAWLGGSLGGTPLIGGIMGLATGAVASVVLEYGNVPDIEDAPSDNAGSKVRVLVKVAFVVVWLGLVAVTVVDHFVDGLTYGGSMWLSFLFGIGITGAFTHWRAKRSSKRQQSK